MSRKSKPSSQPPYVFSCSVARTSAEIRRLGLAHPADCCDRFRVPFRAQVEPAVAAIRPGRVGRTVHRGPPLGWPALVKVGPPLQEPRHLVPVAALIGPVGPLTGRSLLRRFRGNVRPHRLVDPAAFVRVGHLTGLGVNRSASACSTRLGSSGSSGRSRDPTDTPIPGLNVI